MKFAVSIWLEQYPSSPVLRRNIAQVSVIGTVEDMDSEREDGMYLALAAVVLAVNAEHASHDRLSVVHEGLRRGRGL